MTNIPIFLSSDNNYAPFVATTTASVLYNTKSFCNFYILDGGIKEENKERIYSLKEKFNNFSIEFIKINIEKEFKKFNAPGHLNLATYSRFLIPNLKPNLEKAIYLDADIIVMKDIADFYNQSLDEYILGAVWERALENQENEKRKIDFELSSSHKYFNAGAIMINVQKWPKEEMLTKLFQIQNRYNSLLKCADQDVLNKIFDNNYKVLQDKFNWINHNYEYSVKKEEPIVIRHFNGPCKPWHIHPDVKEEKRLSFTIDKDEFWKYAKMTPFYDILVQNTQYKSNTNLQKFLVLKLMHERKNAITR